MDHEEKLDSEEEIEFDDDEEEESSRINVVYVADVDLLSSAFLELRAQEISRKQVHASFYKKLRNGFGSKSFLRVG